MHPQFTQLTPQWFKRAYVYTGSIGPFRYRYANDQKNNQIHVAVYSHSCYEVATDRVYRDFSWDEAGVQALQQWMQEMLERFERTGTLE